MRKKKKIHINVLYTLTSTNMATVQNNEVIPGKLNAVHSPHC